MFQDNQTAAGNQTANQPFTSNNLDKKINFEKTIGYVLLLAGLAMIFMAVFLIFNVLTGKSKAPSVVSYSLPPIDLAGLNSQLQIPEGLQLPEGFQLVEATPSSSAGKFQIPNELINDSINTGFYFLLMTFIVSAGSKVAGIGVKLIKEIKVKV